MSTFDCIRGGVERGPIMFIIFTVLGLRSNTDMPELFNLSSNKFII